MYTIQIPRSGWYQEPIVGGSSILHDLSCLRVNVEQSLDERRCLVVSLVEVGGKVEIEDALIKEWQAEPQAEAGGYWVEGPGVPASQIRLVA